MKIWWADSPYYYAGIYLGGDEVFCTNNTNLTSTWITTVSGYGWAFLPAWVGPQDPCGSFTHAFPLSDFTTDYADGETSADHAISAAQKLGLSHSVIYYDMESWGGTGGDCLTSAENFLAGWETEMNAFGWIGGVYGSASGSRLDAIYNDGSRPTEAWISWPVSSSNASWNSPWDINSSPYSVPNGDWVDDHRFHQYYFDTSSAQDCYGGVCLQVDRNCSVGYVARANSTYTEFSEPSGYVENDGKSEDVPPCY
ncbi:MAG: DUF1906 domain-containing protein [Streptosporangiaceae bacterium]